MTKDFLEQAALKGSEPLRGIRLLSRGAFRGIRKLRGLAAIPVFQEKEREEKLLSFSVIWS